VTWRDEQLHGLLLQLPLPALQLLLISDHLRVASEDTLLYTASQSYPRCPAMAGQAALQLHELLQKRGVLHWSL
jgi:hypothetical protein